MRSSVVALLVTLSLAFAGETHAGDLFTPPSNFGSCGSLEPADDSMIDPNGAYSAVPPNCDATEDTPEGRRACKDGVEVTIELYEAGFEQSREAGFAGCDNWLEACRVSCFPT